MAGEISFIEFGVANTKRGRAFYEALFGWTFAPGPAPGCTEVSGVGVAAGMHGEDPAACPYVFFRVEDMTRALDRVRALGGTVRELDVELDARGGGTTTGPGAGRFVLCRDDQGSPFGLHQPAASETAPPAPEAAEPSPAGSPEGPGGEPAPPTGS